MIFNRVFLRFSYVLTKALGFLLPILWKVVKAGFYVLAAFVVLLLIMLIF